MHRLVFILALLTVSIAPAHGSSLVTKARSYMGTNPTGWRHVWCGKFMQLIAPSAAARVKNPAMAISWASLPRTSCQVGAVGVMRHHVGVVSDCRAGQVTIVSGNSIGRVVAEATYPIRRFVAFVRAD